MTEQFGNYELHRKIGGGGMADVYAARRMTASGAMACALKRIRPQGKHDDDYRELFLREGELAMKLRHGNLVPVFDVGEHDGCLYMAMELIDGVSLDRFLELVRAKDPKRPNLAEAIYVTRNVLRALHYVHTFTINEVNQRIVHRDVSPQNVMVTSSGEIKLADFGIARMVDGHTTARVYGKLGYMPREQYMGNPVQQSDLFGVGVMFYELLTGRRLREGCRTQQDFHEAIIEGRLPELPRGLPSEVFETLAGLLEVEPARRTQSAKDGLRLLGSRVRSGDTQLDLEDLYVTHVDSRHSWYTELTAQAEEPADTRGGRQGKRRRRDKTVRRARPGKVAAVEDAAGERGISAGTGAAVGTGAAARRGDRRCDHDALAAADGRERRGGAAVNASERRERIQAGQVVAQGRYVLLEELGRGGLAIVFRATDTRDGAVVALKVLCDRYVGRPEREERLRREFEYARRVEHPAVVEVKELGALEDGRPFFSMELVEGVPLARITSGSGGLPFVRMRRLARAIAEALEAVHGAGIVHRDVKPENVLVLDGDRVKLIDFGMAGDEDAPAVPAGHTARLTRVNDLLGTHEYMAPEQVRKAPPRRAMDVFALGVVMYEMLTSITPYSGMGVREYVELQIAGDPFLRSAERWARIKGAPATLAELIDDCRRRDPEARPEDMLEVVRRLDTLEGVISLPTVAAVSVGAELQAVALIGTGAEERRWPGRRLAPWIGVLAVAAMVVLWRWLAAEVDTGSSLGTSTAVVAEVDRRNERAHPAAVGLPGSVTRDGSSMSPAEGVGATPSEPSSEDDEPRQPGPASATSTEPARSPTQHSRHRRAFGEPRRGSQPEPTPPQSAPSPSETECVRAIAAAQTAFGAYRWEAVLAHTSNPSCWSERKAEHIAMRTEALMEEGHWADCVRTGRRSAEPKVRRFAERCQKRLDTIASTP